MSTTNSKPPPQLPQGNSSVWKGVSENFAFHSSPESFIAARLAQLQQQDPDILEKRPVVRAKILNRNVAIVTSYKHVRAILAGGDEDTPQQEEYPRCVAGAAYDDLMSQFFPSPNLLLADGCPHEKMRQYWHSKMDTSRTQLDERARMVVTEFVAMTPLGSQIDLYSEMKTLAWRILLGCFLDLYPDESLFPEVQRLQEELLRGQFSLMPVRINTGFWKSPRKRGIDARKSLQALISQRLVSSYQRGQQSVFGLDTADDKSEVVNHVLMSTSSLAVKGLASILTAYLLNLFLFEAEGELIYQAVCRKHRSDERRRLLESVYKETERLSPPIVGVMRRVVKDVVLPEENGKMEVLVPAGWDVWLYIVGATRDHGTFGGSAEKFEPYRYLDDAIPQPLGFGIGPKTCLGRDLMRNISILVAEQLLSKRITISGEVNKPGLKGWLGWAVADPGMWATDMKQLPTQHPVDPVLVEFAQF